MLCRFFRVTLQLWRDWAAERAHWSLSFYSCYTHRLMGLISPSPPSFPLAISISTYPFLHQFPLTAWFFLGLSGEQTRAEKRETQRDKEEAKDDKNKLEYGNGQTDLSKKKRSSVSLKFGSLCDYWPSLVWAKRFRSADTPRIRVTCSGTFFSHFFISFH